jgi:hypothetical protein
VCRGRWWLTGWRRRRRRRQADDPASECSVSTLQLPDGAVERETDADMRRNRVEAREAPYIFITRDGEVTHTTDGKIRRSASAAASAFGLPPDRQSPNSNNDCRTGFENDTRP